MNGITLDEVASSMCVRQNENRRKIERTKKVLEDKGRRERQRATWRNEH